MKFEPIGTNSVTKRARSSESRRRKKSRALFVGLYLSPALLCYIVLVIWPLIQAFQFSLYRWSGLSNRATYIGLQNFQKLIHDHHFGNAFRHNLWILVIGGSCIVALSLMVAHLLAGTRHLNRLLRGVILFPQMMSLTVVAILWLFIYNFQSGLLNGSLKLLHLKGLRHTWLANPHYALAAVTVAFAWYAVGFYAMIFSAGISGIPAEVFEAANLDGATGWRKFRFVTWDNLWSVKRIVGVHLTITVLNVFSLVYLMEGQGDRKTDVLLTYMYENAFQDSRLGYATAIAVANFIAAMIFSFAILKIVGRDPTEARA